MKLLYVINRMTNLAGIERILSCKMNFLAENTSYQIILTTYEQDGRPFLSNITRKYHIYQFKHLYLFENTDPS